MSVEEYGDEKFPRNEWVRAESVSSGRYGTLRETYYMLLPHGAMMRTYTVILEVVPDKPEPTGPKRAKAISTSEALCFIPGNFTLKLKRGSEIIVLVPKK
ncbi:hypothetical protein [Streptomyces sp. CHB9.2]|uniref:hypothetical protein n=1 Tax=Streptomyces sp. CHB9.2 TaxID=2841670 RepID=UPI002094D0F4|nr:hypothetical protein [Streptomyces sp. CHB9.2]MCO6704795.1 hypothetical protein [Streptomyces sp. CHB9.2]